MDVINRGKAVCSVTNKQRRRQPVKKPPGVSLLAQLAPCTMTPPSLPLLTVHRHQSDTPNTCHLKKNNRYNSLVRSNFCLRYSFPLLAVGSRTRNPCGSRRRFFSLPSNFRTIHLRPSIRVLFFSYPLRSPRICTVIVIRSKPVLYNKIISQSF
jgi:hypothetical protein